MRGYSPNLRAQTECPFVTSLRQLRFWPFLELLRSLRRPLFARVQQAPVQPTLPVSSLTSTDVSRATLDNGMKVVVVRNPLAPVVTVKQNYRVGGNETPEGFPGMAHAQEHMAFRGCFGLRADQISAIFAQLGGFGNADTQQNITQYFVTVPVSPQFNSGVGGSVVRCSCSEGLELAR